MTVAAALPRYDRFKTYQWNYDHAPDPVTIDVPHARGAWTFCGLTVDSPLGVPAGPLLNGRWCLYYASLGFDVLTYKTVRSVERECYPLPNLQPVECGDLTGTESVLPARNQMNGSWAVSYGMPSKKSAVWRPDIEETRRRLPQGKLLCVSVVGTVQPDWTLDNLADDYAKCAKWAIESGADVVESNFSCPNVSTCDGQLFQNPADAEVVAHRIREAIGKAPYIVKIGHLESKEAAHQLLDSLAPHIDALAMTNSVAVTVHSGNTASSKDGLLFDGQRRGICGAAIRRASLAQVRMTSQLASEQIHQSPTPVEIIAVGGASTAEHVREYLDAGAGAVHLATAAMVRPEIAVEIRDQLFHA